MPRGGYRPGAGRPKGAKGAKKSANRRKAKSDIPADIAEEAENADMSPLDYMLKVMRDPGSDKTRRDRMAVAAAPFVHSRAGEKGGKKKDLAEAAEKASSGRFGARPAPKVVSMRK